MFNKYSCNYSFQKFQLGTIVSSARLFSMNFVKLTSFNRKKCWRKMSPYKHRIEKYIIHLKNIISKKENGKKWDSQAQVFTNCSRFPADWIPSKNVKWKPWKPFKTIWQLFRTKIKRSYLECSIIFSPNPQSKYAIPLDNPSNSLMGWKNFHKPQSLGDEKCVPMTAFHRIVFVWFFLGYSLSLILSNPTQLIPFSYLFEWTD